MKHYLTIFLLCLFGSLFAQKDGATECAANAGKDKSICYTDAMTLSAPSNLNYVTPLDATWSYEGGPLGSVTITNSNQLDAVVNFPSGATTWPVGDYRFKFCVKCQDINLDGTHDEPCDEVIITVKPDVTQPVITENDGTQDGSIIACSQTTFNVNAPASGETVSITYVPDDNLLSHTLVNGVVTLTRQSVNHQEECDYEVTYTITNGGCTKKESVKVHFVSPYDPNNDGVIEGRINFCPSCSNTLDLIGDYPGCDAQGVWTKTSGPGTMTVNSSYGPSGYANVTVSQPGTYTFTYTVTNASPCVTTPFSITCTVYEIGSFSVGPTQFKSFCLTELPVGTYHYCFNSLSNAVYEWTGPAGITFSNPHGNCSDIIVTSPVALPVVINVTATRYYEDKDCAGPLAPTVVTLPGTDPEQNWAFIKNFLNTPTTGCISQCTSISGVQFSGAPQVKVKANQINFLCSDGTETIKLRDYFTVANLLNSLEITVVSQPAGSPPLPTYISGYEWLQLSVNGCGQYKFKIVATNYDYSVTPPTPCSSTAYLTINIETPQQATAGTDQVKCLNEPIRLNANNPYCYAQGTWKQVGCTTCDVIIQDVHDPNTPIFLNGTVPPAVLEFEWSFESEDQSCVLTDVTQVEIRDCYTPCPKISVVAKCVGGEICLTVVDQNNNPIDPSVYDIKWPSLGIAGNPVCIPYTGPVHYDVTVFLWVKDQALCRLEYSGDASCERGCDARVVESCDECGNVILTLVDAVTGDPIVPTTYEHEINWTVYGAGAGDDTGIKKKINPIVIEQHAYYSLHYVHYVYPPGVPHVPGYQTDICEYDIAPKPVSIRCEGRCDDFNNFFIAAYGDDLAISRSLVFPGLSSSMCRSFSTYGTLGVFHNTPPYAPVSTSSYNIVWRNGSTNTYVTGNLNTINSVTITSKENPCCKWEDAYEPCCLCSSHPDALECKQPVTRMCRPDGTIYYVNGVPEIVWSSVSCATEYELEFNFDAVEKCCTPRPGMPTGTITITQASSPFIIPANYYCFSVRIRAHNPDGPRCEWSEWSGTFEHCNGVDAYCTPVITVCGCCGGHKESETMGLPVRVETEENVLAYLKAYPGTEHPTLRSALNAAGVNIPSEEDFSVYPNPASDQLVVHAGNTVKGSFSIQISDMLQRQWRNETFEAAHENTLNISDLPKGMYLVTVRNIRGEIVLTQKITVLR